MITWIDDSGVMQTGAKDTTKQMKSRFIGIKQKKLT